VSRFRWTVGVATAGDVLLLLTDALADWALASEEHRSLLVRGEMGGVQQAVVSARSQQEMANDDLTMIRIAFTA
jgi:hypothetical protein